MNLERQELDVYTNKEQIMENLFRLALTRPAIVQDEDAPSVRLDQDSQFQTALGQAQQSENPREALKAVARQFIASTGFVDDPKNLAIYDQLKALEAALDTLERKKTVSNADVVKAIEEAFSKKLADLIKSKVLDTPTASLRDSLLAIKLLPEEHGRPIESLTNLLRDIEVIFKANAANDFPRTGAALRRYRRRSVLLPININLRSSLSTLERQKQLEQERKKAEEEQRKQAEVKLNLYRQLSSAIGELTNLGGDQLQTTSQKADPGFLVPAASRSTQLALQESAQHEQLAKLDLQRLQNAVGTGGEIDRIAQPNTAQIVAADTIHTRTLSLLFIAGKGPFTPLAQGESAFRLKASATEMLSASTQELLKERGLTVAETPLDTIVETLRREQSNLTSELDTLFGRPVQRSLKRIGATMVMTTTPLASVWSNLVVAGNLGATPLPLPFNMSVPDSHGSVAPAGVADLLVVKQQLVRYEAADVAHIENVLKGEKKEREHTTRRETEEFSLVETETTTTQERELESTSRFEMSRETSTTIKEDAALKAGLTLSGKYGPTVEFSASAEGSMSRSKEEATKSAANFSQDVTERSANKVTERVLNRSSLRVTNEVIEKNTHTLDNIGGTGHISGVYQWVNKVYQAQMFNYGIRMMYDFMVPEPAAFLISALESAHANATELEKPAPFTLRPDQINEANYFTWVQQYGATDVQPPPEVYKTKSLDFKAGGGENGANYNHSGQLQIDEGYQAIYGSVGLAGNIWEDTASLDVVLGRRTNRIGTGLGVGFWSTNLDGETDTIPVALDSFKYSQIAVAVEVKCQRTERAMLKWRLETHAKITQAYQARLSEYEEKLASLELQAGVVIRGRNPLLNMELMNDELKKHCITILTEQHFDLFDSIQAGAYNVPQINLTENAAEGPYVRFFEQAFEWEQMTWLTYPYFWGRKSKWHERIAYEDADSVFNQFLKAGYCRVVVPVRPGFEGAIDHFMTYGEIWNGGPLPPISNPLYLPIADEIAERLDRPGDEIPQGDPWLVRIPTTLVHLRPDDKLPKWKQAANGDWVEE
jgi:hypothetical protein